MTNMCTYNMKCFGAMQSEPLEFKTSTCNGAPFSLASIHPATKATKNNKTYEGEVGEL